MNLLIIRLSALGDVAMCIPAIYSVAQRYPQDNIYVLVTSGFTKLFVHAPKNLHLIPFERSKHRSFIGFQRLLHQLHRLNITHVADLHNVNRSWHIDLFFRMMGVKVAMLNKQRAQRKNILQGHINSDIFKAQHAVFEALGIPCNDTFQGFHFADEEYPLPAFIPTKASDETWIGIAPFARYQSKIYPLELMQKVVEGCASRAHSRVFLLGGGEKEKQQCQVWASYKDNIYALPGRMTLMQEMHLMQHLDVMLSMDSANQHIASLMRTPVVTLWGGTTPSCGFQPWQQSNERQLCAYLDCQPCSIAGTANCPKQRNYQCMRALTPTDIIQALNI